MQTKIYRGTIFLIGWCLLGITLSCSKDENASSSTDVPNTEIYLSEISFPENKFTIGKAVNVTNNLGYDNQPMFLPGNGLFLFTSVRNADAKDQQTDIFSYSIESKEIDRVTNTAESEFSPTLSPNGESVSVVRIDLDGEQRLWEFPIKSEVVTNSDTRLVFPEITRVGYHLWKNQDEAFLFLVDENSEGDEHSLVKASRNDTDTHTIATKIGRSLTKLPNSDTLIYVDKTFAEDWSIKKLESDKDLAEIILPTLKGSEDLVWLDERYLLMAKDAVIYMHSVDNKYADWVKIADSEVTGITGNITRLAVSPDKKWLAIVVTE